MKTCTKCKVDRPLTDFSDHMLTKDGKQSWCKICIATRNRERYADMRKTRPAKPRGRAKAGASEGHAICPLCRQEKLLEAFYDHNYARNGKGSYCKECVKLRSKLRYAEAKRKFLEKTNGTTERKATQEPTV